MAPRSSNRSVTGDRRRSDPETAYPIVSRISAIPLIPMPPIPIKWTLCDDANIVYSGTFIFRCILTPPRRKSFEKNPHHIFVIPQRSGGICFPPAPPHRCHLDRSAAQWRNPQLQPNASYKLARAPTPPQSSTPTKETSIHPENASAAPPNPALIFEMLQAHQRTAVLRAAIDLDIFRAVGEGPGDAASIASQCSASERGVRILCDFLVINGILSKQDGHYRHTPTSALFLDPNSPASLASTAKFLGNPAMREPYEHLAEVVRNGRTTLPGDGTVSPENPIWVQFAESMAPMMAPVAGPLATLALGGQTGPFHVLDIAAGHGLFGIAVATQNPEARITAVDWAPVLRVAAANAV